MSRALALTLAIALLTSLLATPHIGTQAQDQVEVKIRWATYINPTDGDDLAYGTCVFGDYIAVVGQVNWNLSPPYGILGNPYVALLRKSDGIVVKEWIGNERGGFANCISIDGKLYAFGYTEVSDYFGPIYVFDADLNIIAKITGKDPVAYSSLAYDGKALYLGGWLYEDVNGDGKKEMVWLVEKRDPVSLSLIASKKIYLSSWISGAIIDIGVDPSTGNIWAVGFYASYDKAHSSLIVILDSTLKDVKVIDYPRYSEGYIGGFTGIAFDGGQHAYVSGYEGIAKFSVDGKLVAIDRDVKAMSRDFKWGKMIVYGYDYLYTFGVEKIGDYDRQVLYIHDTDLNMVKKYVLSGSIEADSYFSAGRPVLEGRNIYVAGFGNSLSGKDLRVIVYALSIEGVSSAATMVITTAPTTTAMIATIIGLIAAGVMLAIVILLQRR